MNKGVEILLSRMQSCPEEFTNVGFNGGGVSRWTEIMSAVTSRINKTHPIIPLLFLTDEEVKLLYIGYMQLQGDAFTRSVVDTLIKNEEGAKDRQAYIKYQNQLPK